MKHNSNESGELNQYSDRVPAGRPRFDPHSVQIIFPGGKAAGALNWSYISSSAEVKNSEALLPMSLFRSIN
jgi:hypothetical protein